MCQILRGDAGGQITFKHLRKQIFSHLLCTKKDKKISGTMVDFLEIHFMAGISRGRYLLD